jgi:hypothetical protein
MTEHEPTGTTIDILPGVSISAGKDVVGTVSFDGAAPGFWSIENAGRGWGWPGSARASTGVRFYDVPMRSVSTSS